MKVLLFDSIISNSVKNKAFTNSYTKKVHSQNFGKLFVNGILKNGNEITVITRNVFSRKIFNKYDVKFEEGVYYLYIFFINIPFLRPLSVFISSFILCIFWYFKNKSQNIVIICNTIHTLFSIPTVIISKIFKVRIVGLVADYFPEMNTVGSRNKKFLKKATQLIGEKLYFSYINEFDYYILFTDQMNEVVNKKNKPYIIIEGMVDFKLNSHSQILKKESKIMNIVYAGGLYEKYGVKNLIEAFKIVKGDDLRLSLYGSGELEGFIKINEKEDSRIKYYGVVSSEDIFEIETNATLLVNPRPSNLDFSKYSFPSKILEYMASGTAVLTTKLLGMPKEYEEYLFLFNVESIDAFANTLKEVVFQPMNILIIKGQSSRDFVLRNKNNIIQTKKIFEMINARS
jgi:glycosyltransferase involved in cell wall biosynthesis